MHIPSFRGTSYERKEVKISMSRHSAASKHKKSGRQTAEGTSDLSSCSMQDCTGLIPAGLDDEAELEAYQELYSFLPEPPED